MTPREAQVACLAAKGMPNKEIGARLGLTEGTIKVYLSRLFTKAGIQSRWQLPALLSRMQSAQDRANLTDLLQVYVMGIRDYYGAD